MDDIVREASNIVNARDMKEALSDLREFYLEEVTKTAKAIYDEHLEVGFTEEQAFDIAKSYTLEFCALEFI